jgi:Holliday junction resolvasome RuvABC endonuclease subunit
MKDIVLGFDIGASSIAYSAITVPDYGLLCTDLYCFTPPVLKNVYSRTLHTIQRFNPFFVVIEAPFCNIYKKGISSIISLTEVKSMIKLACDELEIGWTEVTPPQAKAVCGNGRADKPEIISYIKKEYGKELCEHEADAICIARSGWDKYRILSRGMII